MQSITECVGRFGGGDHRHGATFQGHRVASVLPKSEAGRPIRRRFGCSGPGGDDEFVRCPLGGSCHLAELEFQLRSVKLNYLVGQVSLRFSHLSSPFLGTDLGQNDVDVGDAKEQHRWFAIGFVFNQLLQLSHHPFWNHQKAMTQALIHPVSSQTTLGIINVCSLVFANGHSKRVQHISNSAVSFCSSLLQPNARSNCTATLQSRVSCGASSNTVCRVDPWHLLCERKICPMLQIPTSATGDTEIT